MAVDSQHPDYARKIARWRKNRDAFSGEDAVKEQDKLYLPAPGGFTADEYKAFKQRAKWYGATSRTVGGLTGASFQKDPQIEASDTVLEHFENITLTSISGDLFASIVLSDVQLMGRYGVLLDYNPGLRRPYWSGYPAESIINWRVAYENGESRLTMVVLKEEYLEEIDQFEYEERCRYRVCYLNDEGTYEVAIHELIGRDQGYGITSSYVPTRRLRTLDFIPFQFFGGRDLTPDVSAAMLDGLIDVNYGYYRHSADYEHGLFLTGVPTPVITGHVMDEGERLPIGSLGAWVLPNSEAKAYLLEYQGHGLESHERAMANDKVEMATLGARLLEEQPGTQETLGAVQIRHSGETGSLRSTANLVSEGLTRVLQWHHWWNGDTENVQDEKYSFTLNTDFSTARLEPQEIQSLMQLWQGGGISKETLFWNLKQGEIIPADSEFKKEEAKIEAQPPARLPFGEMPDDEEDEPEPDDEQDDNEEGDEAA